jgi:hypothetical protein
MDAEQPFSVDKHLLRTFIFLAAIAVCPALFVRIPAMVDYPSHLARMYARAGTRAANPHYQVRWGI